MIKLIAGNKGTGKTKALIDLVNQAGKTSKGNVVCIEKGDSLKFDVNYHIRLIDIEEYKTYGADAYYGFIAGLLAGNYDITEIFADATLKIISSEKGTKDIAALESLIVRLSELLKSTDTQITFTVSCDEKDLPDSIKSYVIH
ncbi:hypothetical protein U6B65_09185 [Oscillospiraceae bacterium MB08-C2-2]|nr:hypothetical protein U6B65_09185 [Oscillospiraceae bacterium MB08-C2-2]